MKLLNLLLALGGSLCLTLTALGQGGSTTSSTSLGGVYVIKPSGQSVNFSGSNTDAGRGEKLFRAVTAAVSGETVQVGPGTYALAGIYSKLILADGVSLKGAGINQTLITSPADLQDAGAIIKPGTNSHISDMTVQGVAANGVYQAPIGISDDISTPDTGETGILVTNVKMIADSDGFYIKHDTTVCTAILRNCILVTEWDACVASAGTPIVHRIDCYNCRWEVTGPSETVTGNARGVLATYTSVIRVFGGSMTVTNGGVTLTAGAATLDSGEVELYGTQITVSNGADPKYDLSNAAGGTIKVAGGSGTGTAGVFLTSGTVTALNTTTASDVAYDATSWNANTDAPTKNAVRDKFESLAGGGFDSTTIDTPTWSDGLNASNLWSFDLSGTDTTMLFGSGLTTFSHGINAQTAVFPATTSILLGTAGSAVGNIGFRNATSGTATLAPPTGALGTYTVTLPNAASTLPIFGQQITFAGPSAPRTITLPDAAFTAARTDAANVFTGVQTIAESTLGTVAGEINAGDATSLEIPNDASKTTDAFGEIAGDNNAWAAGRGAIQHFDGTANTLLVGALSSDTPTNGQVPKWNTGGTITWEADSTGSALGSNLTSATNNITSDNNAIVLAGTSEDFVATFSANTLTFTSTTGLNVANFGAIALRTNLGVQSGVASTAEGSFYLYSSGHAFASNIVSSALIGEDSTYTLPPAGGFLAGSAAALTSGRIPYASTNGILTDEAAFAYNAATNTLTAENISSSGTQTVGTLNATTTNATTFGILDNVNQSHALRIVAASDLTASRNLTITTGDAARAITLTGDFVMSGANNITLTTTGATNVTLPTSGTLLGTTGVGTGLTALNGENVQDDTIDDDSLDFGTGADQISAADVPIADTGSIFTATDTEAALLELAKVPVKVSAGSYTVGTTDARELYGGVIYVTSTGTVTVPAVAAGASFTVITIGAIAVNVDVNAADLIYLNGTALADGDKITNGSTAGDIAVFTYFDGTGWYAATNTGWTDTN